MRRYKAALSLFLFSVTLSSSYSQPGGRVSVTQEIQVLSKGSKSIFKCDIFYDKEKDVIVTHHYYPAEFVKVSNRLGEMKIYFPESNTVSVQQSESLSTTNELLYYFINNKVADLGLSKEGFRLAGSNREDSLTVTTWQAPPALKEIDRIKIVFDKMLPVYAEYLWTDGSVKKKIFYSRYSDFRNFRIPLRITEISFQGKADSTIRLSVFSNVRTGDFPENSYFNFKIPENAKITK
jgi:hypothetical protein